VRRRLRRLVIRVLTLVSQRTASFARRFYLNVERALICLVSHASREVKNKEQHCNFMTKKTFMFNAKCDVRARKLSNEKEGGESGNFQNDLSSTLQKV